MGNSLANKHYLKVADLSATKGDYYKATEFYERVAKSSVNNHLMKWSVKEYFLKAGLCHLATNVSIFLH
jgi:alpha-soluble NSF attachment protein